MDLEQQRTRYCELMDRALKRVTVFLAGKPEVERIVLFGSYVAGKRDLFTDLDLLVVMSSELDFVSRTADLYRQIRVGVDFDLLVYTPEEFEEQREKGFIRKVLETGQVLYEKKQS